MPSQRILIRLKLNFTPYCPICGMILNPDATWLEDGYASCANTNCYEHPWMDVLAYERWQQGCLEAIVTTYGINWWYPLKDPLNHVNYRHPLPEHLATFRYYMERRGILLKDGRFSRIGSNVDLEA